MATNDGGIDGKKAWYKRVRSYIVGLIGVFITAVIALFAGDVYGFFANVISGSSTASVEGYVRGLDGDFRGTYVAIDFNRLGTGDEGRLVIDADQSASLGDGGHFVLPNISEGTHSLTIFQVRSSNGDRFPIVLYEDRIVVPSGDTHVTLPDIVLDQ